MEVRLVVKEVKRTSYACDVCKKRKGKCSGGSPCAYCTEHGIACSYLKANKKRGPAKKQKADNQLASSTNSEGERQLVTTSGPRPLLIDDTLTLDLEKLNLVDMYVDFAEDTHLFTNKERLLHPTTIGQRLMTTAVLGLMSKANGCFARAEQYISDARTLAVQAMEETSVEAAIAFTVLAVCFPMRDRRHTLYANMAHGIAKTLPGKNVEEKKMYEYSLLGTTMLDASMDVNLKRKVLLTQVSHIMAFKDLNPRDILAAVMTRLYCNLLPKMMDHLTLIERPWLLTQVTLTDDEKNNLLSDIHVAEWVIDQHNSKLGKIKELYVYSIKVLKVIILWRSGDIEGAIREADFPTKYSLEDTVNLRVVNDLQYVWLLSLFYFSVGVPEPAETLYTRFTVLCERYGQPFLMEFLPHPSKIVSRVIELESISPIPDLCRPLPTPSQNNSPPQVMATSPQGSPQQPTSPNPNTPPQDLSRNTSSSSMEKSPPTSPEYLNTPSPTINPTPTVPITNATIIAPASSPLCTTTKSITDYSALLAVSDPQTPSYAVQNIAKLDEPIINIPLQHQNQQHQQQYQQQQNQRQHQPTPQPQQPQNEAETLATTTKFVTQYLQTIIQDGNQTQRQPNQQQQTQPQQVTQQMWQQPTDTQQRQPPIPQLAQIPQAHMHILQKAQEHKQTQNYTELTFPPQQQPLTQQHFQQPPQQQQQIYQPQQFSTQQYTQYQQPQQQIPSPQQQSFAQPQQYNTMSQQQPSPQQYTQQPSPPQQYNQQPSPTQYVQQQPSPPQQYTQPTSQQYTQQPSPPQQYSTQQPSPPQQQYTQPPPQQYTQQTSPPQQQYSQPSPPQQQQYSQTSPQQYTQQPSPPQQYVQTQPQPQQYVQPQQIQQPPPQQQYTQIQAYPQPAHTPEVQHMITQCNKLHDTLRDQMEDRIAQRKLQIKAQMQQAPPPIQPHQQTQYPGQQQPQQLPFQQQPQPQLQPTPFQPQQTQQPQLQQTQPQQTQQATYINTTIEDADRRLSFSFLDDLLNLE